MSDVNKVFLQGRLCRDPDMRHVGSLPDVSGRATTASFAKRRAFWTWSRGVELLRYAKGT